MTSAYHTAEKQLSESRCEVCHGLGECDDAEPGDISYGSWKCDACGGTGFSANHSRDLERACKRAAECKAMMVRGHTLIREGEEDMRHLAFLFDEIMRLQTELIKLRRPQSAVGAESKVG